MNPFKYIWQMTVDLLIELGVMKDPDDIEEPELNVTKKVENPIQIPLDTTGFQGNQEQAIPKEKDSLIIVGGVYKDKHIDTLCLVTKIKGKLVYYKFYPQGYSESAMDIKTFIKDHTYIQHSEDN